ncbi:MAG: glycosyltransferase [Armatimonadota bacterium]|nr:glycosyltransferase [Armatimonadota bacterium]MDW8026618.1 glycosyltransferase [Armatimonadota bacterium]
MTLICASAFTLTSERGTPCHLMRAIARYVPVIYINPPYSRSRWQKEKAMLQVEFDNLKVITPVLLTTFRFLPRKIRRYIVAFIATPKVLDHLEKNRQKQPIVLWSYLGELTLPLLRALKANLTCYHRLDDYAIMLPKDRPLEKAIEKVADLLFVVSPTLQEQYRHQGRKAILLPNGVDIEHFSKAILKESAIPDDLACLPPPRIGFVGTVDPLWVDTDLLLNIAAAKPKWSTIVIGNLNKWQPPRIKPENIHFIGKRPYKILPYYLKGLDVCIIPFKDNAVTRAASPLKLYEYLAAGRAVVSSPVSDLAYFGSLVWCAKRPDEFICAIEEALKTAHDPTEQMRRVAAVTPHSWQERAQTALKWIYEMLGGGSGNLG